MTPERYNECLAAYGADVRRWPEAERAAAGPAPTPALQAPGERDAAAALDAWLAADGIAAPGDALVRHILESAPQPAGAVAAHAAVRVAWRDTVRRWAARIAGVGLAGSAAGALAATLVLRLAPAPQAAEPIDSGTAFSSGLADWSEE